MRHALMYIQFLSSESHILYWVIFSHLVFAALGMAKPGSWTKYMLTLS
jgi:hypothetical protein